MKERRKIRMRKKYPGYSQGEKSDKKERGRRKEGRKRHPFIHPSTRDHDGDGTCC